MSVATTSAEAPKNRFPGPCVVCGAHVRAWSGTRAQPRPGAPWRLYCAAHRGSSTPPANDRPSNGAPAGGDAPEISEDSARAAIALLRRAATDKRAPEGAVDTATEIATLCVWRTGSAELARELYAALPSKMIAEPADERAADIIGEILERNGTRVIDDATANATADALMSVPVDSPTSRAFAARDVSYGAVAVELRGRNVGQLRRNDDGSYRAVVDVHRIAGPLVIRAREDARIVSIDGRDVAVLKPGHRAAIFPCSFADGDIAEEVCAVLDAYVRAVPAPASTPGPARLAARFPIHPAPAPKRERASKGARRWAHRKGSKSEG